METSFLPSLSFLLSSLVHGLENVHLKLSLSLFSGLLVFEATELLQSPLRGLHRKRFIIRLLRRGKHRVHD